MPRGTDNQTVLWQDEASSSASTSSGGAAATVGKLMLRQRPQLLFEADGYTPRYLYNGVATDRGEKQWTLAVPFRGKMGGGANGESA